MNKRERSKIASTLRAAAEQLLPASVSTEEQMHKANELDSIDPRVAEIITKSGLNDGNTKDDIVKVAKKSWPATSLKPSQTTMQLSKAVAMALLMLKTNKVGGDLGALVSKDRHILDGHHRWAATILASGSKGKVGGFGANLRGKELLKVLNVISKGMFKVRNGNPGSGKISDFTPGDVRNLLENYVEDGISGKFPWKAEEVRNVLKKVFGSVEEGISIMENNVKGLSKSVPSWAPDRKQMPVIDPGQVDEAAKALNEGIIDWNTPYSASASSEAQANAEEILTRTVSNAKIDKKIDEFLTMLIREGNAINKEVAAAVKEVEGYTKNKVDARLLENVILNHINKKSPWGKDKMSPLLAKLIANGDFIW